MNLTQNQVAEVREVYDAAITRGEINAPDAPEEAQFDSFEEFLVEVKVEALTPEPA